MPKPIFIVKYPRAFEYPAVVRYREKLAKSFFDYHILFVPAESESFQFECYNSEKVNQIDFELLQERVFELVKVQHEPE